MFESDWRVVYHLTFKQYGIALATRKGGLGIFLVVVLTATEEIGVLIFKCHSGCGVHYFCHKNGGSVGLSS